MAEKEKVEEEGVEAVELVRTERLRLVEGGGEEEEEGSTVGLVLAECLVEGGENVTDLVGCNLARLVALHRLYPLKSEETSAEALEMECGTRLVEDMTMNLGGR
jgi:hypothetical protein